MDILYEIEKAKSMYKERDYTFKEADQCIVAASRKYDVHPLVILSILKVENGKIGTLSRNTNGTYDLGPMQINTINIDFLKKEFPGLTWKHLTYDLCTSVFAGTFFLKERIEEADKYWEGVGNYHSKTPSLRQKYLNKVIGKYNQYREYYRKKAKLIAIRQRNIHI